MVGACDEKKDVSILCNVFYGNRVDESQEEWILGLMLNTLR